MKWRQENREFKASLGSEASLGYEDPVVGERRTNEERHMNEPFVGCLGENGEVENQDYQPPTGYLISLGLEGTLKCHRNLIFLCWQVLADVLPGSGDSVPTLKIGGKSV